MDPSQSNRANESGPSATVRDPSLSPARTMTTPSDFQEINARYRNREPVTGGPSPTSPDFEDALESPAGGPQRRITTRSHSRRVQTGSNAQEAHTPAGSSNAAARQQPTQNTPNVPSGRQGGPLRAAGSALRNAFGLGVGDPGRPSNAADASTQDHTSLATTQPEARTVQYPDLAIQAQTASTDPSPPTTTGSTQSNEHERVAQASRETAVLYERASRLLENYYVNPESQGVQAGLGTINQEIQSVNERHGIPRDRGTLDIELLLRRIRSLSEATDAAQAVRIHRQITEYCRENSIPPFDFQVPPRTVPESDTSMADASQPPTETGNFDEPNRGAQQYPPPVRGERRNGMANDNGVWKHVEAYRQRGSGYQVLLKQRAPNRQYWDYEWVASHLIGGAAVVRGFIHHLQANGIPEPEAFRTGSIDFLRESSPDEYEGIVGVAPTRRYQQRDFEWRKRPAQDLQIKLRGIPDPLWYPQAEVMRQFGRNTIEHDIGQFRTSAGITAPPTNPPGLVRTRQNAGIRERTESILPSVEVEYEPRRTQQQRRQQNRQPLAGGMNRITAGRRQEAPLPTPERTPGMDRTPGADAEFQAFQGILRRHPDFLDRLRDIHI